MFSLGKTGLASFKTLARHFVKYLHHIGSFANVWWAWTQPVPEALNKGPLFHIDSSWVTLAKILRSPTFAECAMPITLEFLTRFPMTPGKQPALAEKDVVSSWPGQCDQQWLGLQPPNNAVHYAFLKSAAISWIHIFSCFSPASSNSIHDALTFPQAVYCAHWILPNH